MPGPLAHPPENSLQKPANGSGGRLSPKDSEPHHPPGEVVDHDGEPPTERPDLRQSEGKPGNPEAQGGGDGGQIDMPKVIRPPSGDAARTCLTRLSRLGPSGVPLHPTNGGRPQVEASSGQDLGDFNFSEVRTEDLEAPNDVV